MSRCQRLLNNYPEIRTVGEIRDLYKFFRHWALPTRRRDKGGTGPRLAKPCPIW
jgi:hypothetical protein